MCLDHDSHPPIPPIAGAAVDAERVHLTAADGSRVLAFAARAPRTISGTPPSRGAMLILPDVRGLHRY